MNTKAGIVVRPRHGETITLQDLEKRLVRYCIDREWSWRTFNVLDYPNPFLAAVEAVAKGSMVIVAVGWGSLACAPEALYKATKTLAAYHSQLILLDDDIDTERGRDKRISGVVHGVLTSHQGYLDTITGSPTWLLGDDLSHDNWLSEARASLISPVDVFGFWVPPSKHHKRRSGSPRTLPCITCGIKVHVRRSGDGLNCSVCGSLLQEVSLDNGDNLEGWAESFDLGGPEEVGG